MWLPLTIISGGQTGVDRGALEAALAEGVDCGGWCPADRRAEDGVITDRYRLTPVVNGGYRQRTRKNVMSADVTIIIYHGEIAEKSGTELTLSTCIQKEKPYLLINAVEISPENAAQNMVKFVQQHAAQVVNFGGSRASVAPNIQSFTEQAVRRMLQLWKMD